MRRGEEGKGEREEAQLCYFMKPLGYATHYSLAPLCPIPPPPTTITSSIPSASLQQIRVHSVHIASIFSPFSSFSPGLLRPPTCLPRPLGLLPWPLSPLMALPLLLSPVSLLLPLLSLPPPLRPWTKAFRLMITAVRGKDRPPPFTIALKNAVVFCCGHR